MTQTAVNVFQFSETGPVVHVAGTGDYFDLKNSWLYIKAKYDEKVRPVIFFLHSLFNQIDISLNGKQLSSGGGATYAYKTYLQNLLNYDEEANQSKLQCCLFFKDNDFYMDVSSPNGPNSGLNSRTVFVKQSKPFDLEDLSWRMFVVQTVLC